jgi:hypothetical protein
MVDRAITKHTASPEIGKRFVCPFCGTNEFPSVRTPISVAGWIVFAILLATCAPLCWIGLLMTTRRLFCPSCGKTLQANLLDEESPRAPTEQSSRQGIFLPFRCIFGHHDYSEWAYESANGCSSVRRCKRGPCTRTERKTNHDWSRPEYVQRGSCQQKRICKRCNSEETQPTIHLWSEWKATSGYACQQDRSCTRCGTTEFRYDHL